MFQKKCCRQYQNTHFMFSNFFSPENRAIYNVMRKNMEGPDRSELTIRPIRFTYWVTKATDTHSEYVILIPFPQQRWLQEWALLLLFKYTACLVLCKGSFVRRSLELRMPDDDMAWTEYVYNICRIKQTVFGCTRISVNAKSSWAFEK